MTSRQAVYIGPQGIILTGPEGDGLQNPTRAWRDELINLFVKAEKAGVKITVPQAVMREDPTLVSKIKAVLKEWAGGEYYEVELPEGDVTHPNEVEAKVHKKCAAELEEIIDAFYEEEPDQGEALPKAPHADEREDLGCFGSER